jgi:hypothetical protein
MTSRQHSNTCRCASLASMRTPSSLSDAVRGDVGNLDSAGTAWFCACQGPLASPPLDAGFRRCAPSATSSGQTDEIISETSENGVDDSSSSWLANRTLSSENGTDLTDDECYHDEHDASEPNA